MDLQEVALLPAFTIAWTATRVHAGWDMDPLRLLRIEYAIGEPLEQGAAHRRNGSPASGEQQGAADGVSELHGKVETKAGFDSLVPVDRLVQLGSHP